MLSSFVELLPPTFITKPDPMTVFVGKQAQIQLLVTGASPMDVIWLKNNSVILDSTNYRISSEKNKHSLEILKLNQTDSGVYVCKASNIFGTSICTTEVAVIDKPNFVRTFDSVYVAVGNPLHLESQVDEDIGVTISWTKDDKKLHNTVDCKLSFEDKMASLDVLKANLRDTGNYICTATNDAGSTVYSCVVMVQGKSISLFKSKLYCCITLCQHTFRLHLSAGTQIYWLICWLKHGNVKKQ